MAAPVRMVRYVPAGYVYDTVMAVGSDVDRSRA